MIEKFTRVAGVAIGLAAIIGVAPAIAQDQDATFIDRVKLLDRTAAAAPDDYHPNDAGYVRLVSVPTTLGNAGYCPNKFSNNWEAVFDGGVRLLLRRNGVSGTSMKIWLGAGAPTDANVAVELNPIRVDMGWSSKSCQALVDSTNYSSALLRLEDGSPGFRVQFRRWYVDKPDQQRMRAFASAAGAAATSLGVPAPLSAIGADQAATLSTTIATKDLGSTQILTFAVNGLSESEDGGTVRRVFVGYRPAGPTGFQPSDPHIDLRLRTQASIFHQSTKFEGLDLSGLTTQALRRELPNGGTGPRNVLAIIEANVTRKDELGRLNGALNAADFDASCERITRSLTDSTGLSSTDVAITVWLLGHAQANIGKEGQTVRDGYLSSHCLQSRATELEKVGIRLTAAPIAMTAAAVASIRNQLGAMSVILEADDADQWDATARAVLAGNLAIYDPSEIMGLGEGATLTRDRLATVLSLVFETSGCRLPGTDGAFPAAPTIFVPDPNTRAGWLLASLAGDDNAMRKAVLLRFLFAPVPTSTPAAKPLATQFLLSWPNEGQAQVIRTAYPNGCGGWKPANVYPAPPAPVVP